MKKSFIILILGALALVSCAKEKKYDAVYRTAELESKSSFKVSKTTIDKDGNKKIEPVKYLYVPMTLGTPREVKQANPFYQGDEKIVRLKWAKDGLKVLQMELDERYADNDMNEIPVMTIPGDYKDFKCKENAYGECQNSEEENKDLEWENKAFFEPKFEEISVEELNMLDLANVEGDSCVTLLKTGLIDYEVSSGVINVELEKTYKLKNSWECIRSNYFQDKLDYNSFKVKFFYSLVELDQLVTPGYEAIDYPVTDHDKFGFFKSEKSKLGDEYDRQRTKDEIFLNRWSPKRKNKKLTYYLSKSFNKEKNKELLKATLDATKIINKNFKTANVPFKLEMIQQDENSNISPGDLRYNMVVLIDDPLANGLLGYGPSVKNPLTGEIVKAHTNMYGGVLTSTVRRVYDSAVDLSIKQKKEVTTKIKDIKLSKSAIKQVPLSLISESSFAKEQSISKALNFIPNYNSVDDFDMNSYLQNQKKMIVDEKRVYQSLVDSNFFGINELKKLSLKKEASEKGFLLHDEHAPEFFEIGGTVKNIPEAILNIRGIKNKNGTLKRWKKLTKSQKDKVKSIILVKSYISTFIHEIGHNLGLRHNFSGSFDKENFYTDKEAKSLKMQSAPAYSSIMDYAYSNFNELTAFGKYDIAALRFAYAREVQTEKGNFIKVENTYTKTSDSKSLKQYMFCTDENASLNTTCNRFDEGTSLVEIARHKVDAYNKGYKYRNFRDGRKVFNTFGIVDYLIRRYREFASLRDIFEDYERFVTFLGADIMNSGCSEVQAQDPANKNICDMIKDRIDSVKIVGDFFIEILKTPDHTCALAKKDAPKTIVKLEKLSKAFEAVQYTINEIPKSCFDKVLKDKFARDGFIVVGENGKYLNSLKANNPKYKYASDRDVRGIWIDKVLAMRALFTRTNSRTATDDANMALIDVDYVNQKVLPLIAHLAMGDELDAPIPFKTEKNEEFTIPYVIGSDYKIDQIEGYFGWIKSFFGMPQNGKADLVKTTLKQITSEKLSFGSETLDQAYVMMNFSTVKKIPYYTQVSSRGNTVYYTNGSFTYGAASENQLAKHIIDSINNTPFLSSIDSDLIKKVYKLKTDPDAPKELEDENLKAFFKLNVATQEMLISYKSQGAAIPVESFKKAFGEELGQRIFTAYQFDLNLLEQLMALKKVVMTTPSKEATEEEKTLFTISNRVLKAFLEGKLDDELINYYKKQLKKLPSHVKYTDM